MTHFITRPGPAALFAGLFLLAAATSAAGDQGVQNRQDQQGPPSASMAQQELQMPSESPIVSISAMLPDQLQVGQEFQYEIQVQNVSDDIVVHDLVIEQQSSQALRIEESRVGQQAQQQGQQARQRQQQQGQQQRGDAQQSQQGQQGQQGPQTQQGQQGQQAQQGQQGQQAQQGRQAQQGQPTEDGQQRQPGQQQTQQAEQGQQAEQRQQQGEQTQIPQRTQQSQQAQQRDQQAQQMSPSRRQGQDQGQSNRWTIAMLGPGESETIHVRAIAEQEGQAITCLAIKSFEPALCIPTEFVKPDLELVKQAPDVANLCEEIEIEYYVKNTGSGDAGRFTIRDPLPQGLETIEGERELQFDVDGLQPNDVRKFVATLRATQTGEFASRAVAELQNGNTTHSNRASTRVQQADLAVQIEGPQVQYINQPVSYTVLVANKGDAPAPDTVLAVQFPATAQIVQISEPRRAQASNVSQGQAATGQLPTAANRQDPQAQAQQGQRGQQQTQQGQAQQTEQDQQSQQGQQARQGGQQAQQQRQQPQQGAQREGQQAQQQARQGQPSQGQQQRPKQVEQAQREWQLGTLEPGQAVGVNLTLRFNEAGTIEPMAVAQFVCDIDAAQEQADVRAVAVQQTELIALPDLLFAVVDNQGTVPQGEQVTYTIIVENQGEAPDHNVQVTAQMPEGLEFVEADGPTEVQSEGQQLNFGPLERLAPDERAVYQVTTRAAGEGEVFFRAELTSESLSRPANAEEPTQLFSRTASRDGSQ